jgi:carbon monoxide dehydrogenase subunit G
MDMTGEFRIPAPREAVWKALNDPEILKRSIAGCEELEKTSDTEFTAKVTAKVGPVKARFAGKVTLSDLDPPNGYTITGEGQGGAAGFAKGGAKVRLEPDGDGTLLKYTVNAAIGGKLAQIGARLIDGAAHKMAEEFFASFAANVAGPAPVAAAAAAAPAEVPPAPPGTAAAVGAPRPSEGIRPWIWVGGLIIIAIILLLYFGLQPGR